MNDQTNIELARQLLLETIKHYNLKNRAQRPDGVCEYETEDGLRCAVGRILTDECRFKWKINAEGRVNTSVSNMSKVYGIKLIDPWKPLEKEVLFLRSLQFIHDSKRNWSETGYDQDLVLELDNLMTDHIGPENVLWVKEELKATT